MNPELVLRQSRVLEQSFDAVFVWELGGTIQYWNRGAEDLYRWSKAEAVGKSIHDLLATKVASGIEVEEVERLMVLAGNWEGELLHRTRDGREVTAVSRWVLVPGEGRGLVVETARDISERKAALRAVKESEARLQTIIDTAFDGIVTINPQGRIVSWNRGAERLFGYVAEEVLGRNVSMLMPEPTRGEHDGYLERYVRTGERRIIGKNREVTARHKDGTTFPVELSIGEIQTAEGRLYAGWLHDIRDRKRVEAEREQLLEAERVARNAAEHVARQRAEFVGTLSHELRTPLTAILGWVSLVKKRPLDPFVLRGLAVIETNAAAQVQMVDDLLDENRIVTGKLRLDQSTIDLVQVLGETRSSFEPLAVGREIQLDFQLPSGCVLVSADRRRVAQIAWNLVSNAVKFTPRGGHICVTLRELADGVEFVVADDGEGISADFLPFVFDRFRQGDSSPTRTHGGLGLGLSLVRHLVELHGGTVRADSPGKRKGAKFTVWLPASSASAEDTPTVWSSVSIRGVRVLVVDDDEDVRELVSRILLDGEADVTTVGSAQEALHALPEFKPDVLVADIGMPEMDGYQLVRAIRALGPESGGRTKAAALTAFVRAADRAMALAAGFDAYLTKPLDGAELLSTVARLAERAPRALS